jgi:small subunit ribosomal protein S18
MARRKGAPPAKERRVTKKKTSILTSESIEWIDYKDVNLLRRFMSERAKIRARRVTGNDQQQQAAVARAIKVAREMALLPYSVRQVTQRSKGRRDRDRDRDDRGASEAAEAADVTAAEASENEAFEADEFEGTDEDVLEAATTSEEA